MKKAQKQWLNANGIVLSAYAKEWYSKSGVGILLIQDNGNVKYIVRDEFINTNDDSLDCEMESLLTEYDPKTEFIIGFLDGNNIDFHIVTMRKIPKNIN